MKAFKKSHAIADSSSYLESDGQESFETREKGSFEEISKHASFWSLNVARRHHKWRNISTVVTKYVFA